MADAPSPEVFSITTGSDEVLPEVQLVTTSYDDVDEVQTLSTWQVNIHQLISQCAGWSLIGCGTTLPDVSV